MSPPRNKGKRDDGGGDAPEDEDEEDEEGKEDGHVVQRLEHDHELTFESGHESDQLQDSQQAKGPQH